MPNEKLNTTLDLVGKVYDFGAVGTAFVTKSADTIEGIGRHNTIISVPLQTGQVIGGYAESVHEGNTQLGGAVGNFGGGALGGTIGGIITGSTLGFLGTVETGPGVAIGTLVGGIAGGFLGENAVEELVRQSQLPSNGGEMRNPTITVVGEYTLPHGGKAFGEVVVSNPDYSAIDDAKVSGPQIGGTDPGQVAKSVLTRIINAPDYKPVLGPNPFEDRGGPTSINNHPPSTLSPSNKAGSYPGSTVTPSGGVAQTGPLGGSGVAPVTGARPSPANHYNSDGYNHSIPSYKGGGTSSNYNSDGYNHSIPYAGSGDNSNSRGGSTPTGPSHIVGLSSGSGNGVRGHHSVTGGQGVVAYNGGAAKPPKPQTPNYSSDSYNHSTHKNGGNPANAFNPSLNNKQGGGNYGGQRSASDDRQPVHFALLFSPSPCAFLQRAV